jgi:NADH-quinone oxidoreductase subunit F
MIVMDDRTNVVKAVRRMVEFYAHESCGQCSPCREGTEWLAKIMRRIEAGQGTERDLDKMLELGQTMTGTTICVLSDSAAVPIASSIQRFREDYLALMRPGSRKGAVPAAV